MTAKNLKEAWSKADELMPCDYEHSVERSARAGYDVYYSTAEGVAAYVCDLGDRLEVNLPNGDSVNIWIERRQEFTESDIAEALEFINDAVYTIDDKISAKLSERVGIAEARKKLYAAYDEIAKILKEQHPESKLIKRYNLQDA